MKKKQLSQFAVNLLKEELKVDLGNSVLNDITSNILIEEKKIKASIVARQKITLCGSDFINDFLKIYKKKLNIKNYFYDGQIIKKNDVISDIIGDPKLILTLERTILNFIQHLSSISTSTSKLIKNLNNSKIKLLDTRKTITGLRMIQKYATLTGGAKNHRFGLYDQIFIKDNHIKIAGGFENVLKQIKKKKIKDFIIECENKCQVEKAINFGCKYILLDNMKKKELIESIKLRNSKDIVFEISGGVNKKNINKYSDLDVNYISSGFITQNPEPVDISLDIF